MLQRASWLMLPFGPVPTISQSIETYIVGAGLSLLNAEGPGVAVSLWLLDAEQPTLAVADFVFTGSFGFLCVRIQDGRVWVGAEGVELTLEALLGCFVAVPLWRGVWSQLSCSPWARLGFFLSVSRKWFFLFNFLFFLFRSAVTLLWVEVSLEKLMFMLMSDMVEVTVQQ